MTEERLQEIFNLMIETGLYDPRPKKDSSKRFMCNAINTSIELGVLSDEEASMAVRAIDDYLGIYGTMKQALLNNHSDKQPMDIYRDWANRPKLNWIIHNIFGGNK